MAATGPAAAAAAATATGSPGPEVKGIRTGADAAAIDGAVEHWQHAVFVGLAAAAAAAGPAAA